ncbi:MAG: hypothetical protein SV375_13605 [Thermodesulfobacteriota bacterium]|nr:hypothetical protein [Thermodesulfobacteriota bacterium]
MMHFYFQREDGLSISMEDRGKFLNDLTESLEIFEDTSPLRPTIQMIFHNFKEYLHLDAWTPEGTPFFGEPGSLLPAHFQRIYSVAEANGLEQIKLD